VLYDAAMRVRVRNGTYRAILAESDDEISDQVATKDLKLLTNMDLLVPHGAARSRYYTAGKQLAALRSGIVADRDLRDDSDPFAST
jgi:hypothetical protein